MTTKRRSKEKLDDDKIVIETFSRLGAYEVGRLRQDTPFCWNGIVGVERYRITVEKIEEQPEIIHERIKKLWRESRNHHDRTPLLRAAAKFGCELSRAEVLK